MDTHAAGEMTEQLVILRFFRRDADGERSIGEALGDNANKFNDILGHLRGNGGSKAEGLYRVSRAPARLHKPENRWSKQKDLQIHLNIL